MEIIGDLILENIELVAIILTIAYLIGMIILIINIFRFSRMAKIYRVLTKGAQTKNLEEIISIQTRKLEEAIEKTDNFDSRITELERLAKKSLQKVELLRFNAFNDMGGDLSFALALLNQQGDGIVLSSIYGREDARTYAKAVRHGQGSHTLSIEEQKVIAAAIQSRS